MFDTAINTLKTTIDTGFAEAKRERVELGKKLEFLGFLTPLLSALLTTIAVALLDYFNPKKVN